MNKDKIIKELQDQVAFLSAERNRLQTALNEYGKHHDDCNSMWGPFVTQHACSCGLDEARGFATRGSEDGSES